ncbi:hypothetical protein M231_00713 [Tremella mesenterica]|uniref:Phosducin thioredoxin-like domain-containing protein n=1 Tax=Tremella mesenterica TaxID=5217 RepID=A0A4Q1BVC1_TREME|nr:hypothetical protein M231_00713 [Tremella mesenterica]
MATDLETAALNGTLFRPRSPSPTRSASTASPENTDDELGSDISPSRPPSAAASSQALLHDGPQTGPKGVIEDRKAVERHARRQQEEVLRQRVEEQAERAIVVPSYNEEQAREREEEELRSRWRRERREELRSNRERGDSPRRGGLKEVGQEGFVNAVERNGWAVVLIYESEIQRCQTILASMLHLSLNLPPTIVPLALFRARATTLSFSLLPHLQPDPEDEYSDEEDERKGKPDPDVLPTLLAYRNGELEKTWIRVDWDVGEEGVEGLLRKEGILPQIGDLHFDGGNELNGDEYE